MKERGCDQESRDCRMLERIAAIAPGGFRGLHLDRVSDVWIPLEDADIRHERGYRALSVIGRLRPQASLDTLQRELDANALGLSPEFPNTMSWTLTAVPISSGIRFILR